MLVGPNAGNAGYIDVLKRRHRGHPLFSLFEDSG